MLGPRRGFGVRDMKPHNIVYTMIGGSLLWVGWSAPPPPLCRSFLFLFLSPTQQEPLQSSPPPFPCLPRRKTGRAHRRGHERRPETRPCLSLLSSLERERGGGGWGGNAAQRRSRLGPRLALYINLTKQRERGIGGFVFTRKVKRVSERRRKEVRYMDPRKGGKER